MNLSPNYQRLQINSFHHTWHGKASHLHIWLKKNRRCAEGWNDYSVHLLMNLFLYIIKTKTKTFNSSYLTLIMSCFFNLCDNKVNIFGLLVGETRHSKTLRHRDSENVLSDIYGPVNTEINHWLQLLLSIHILLIFEHLLSLWWLQISRQKKWFFLSPTLVWRTLLPVYTFPVWSHIKSVRHILKMTKLAKLWCVT